MLCIVSDAIAQYDIQETFVKSCSQCIMTIMNITAELYHHPEDGISSYSAKVRMTIDHDCRIETVTQ